MKKTFLYLLQLIMILSVQAQFTSSNLPIILIDTDNSVEITKERITAQMRIVDNVEGRNSVSGPFNNYNGLIAIKGRGSSSWDLFDKKGYTLETQLATGENNNVSLLGMPAENDWVLHGPYADKTLMKNALVYQLGNEMGNYAPRTRYCEMVLNGEYRGVYLLVERIKRDKNRVDIANLNPDENTGDDLTGGYIMRIDRDEGDGYSWEADYGYGLTYFNYYYPDPEDMSQTQRDYIRNYIEEFENSLNTYSFSDTQRGYRAYADMTSFIDYFLISELTKNIDAYRLSTYFYKDKDSNGGKLQMGPLWDYNLSCGGVNIGFGDWGAQPENWVSDELPGGTAFWWLKLLEDPYYNACLYQRWSSLRETILDEDYINSQIDDYAELLDEAKERNFEIFPLAEPVWGNNHSGLTYEGELGMLKSFLADRMEWMDQTIDFLPREDECYECFQDCDDILSTSEKTNTAILYPNPASEVITLRFSLEQVSSVTLEIYDLSGKIVKTENWKSLLSGTHQKRISLGTSLTAGIYTYHISSLEKTLLSGTLVVKKSN